MTTPKNAQKQLWKCLTITTTNFRTSKKIALKNQSLRSCKQVIKVRICCSTKTRYQQRRLRDTFNKTNEKCSDKCIYYAKKNSSYF